jgi:hypothetical protein
MTWVIHVARTRIRESCRDFHGWWHRLVMLWDTKVSEGHAAYIFKSETVRPSTVQCHNLKGHDMYLLHCGNLKFRMRIQQCHFSPEEVWGCLVINLSMWGSWARSIQFTTSHPIPLRSVLMLSPHLCLIFPSNLSPLRRDSSVGIAAGLRAGRSSF